MEQGGKAPIHPQRLIARAKQLGIADENADDSLACEQITMALEEFAGMQEQVRAAREVLVGLIGQTPGADEYLKMWDDLSRSW